MPGAIGVGRASTSCQRARQEFLEVRALSCACRKRGKHSTARTFGCGVDQAGWVSIADYTALVLRMREGGVD